MAFTNSKLVNYKQISPNKDVNRNHIIDTISIHCMAGNLSVEACGNLFSRTATDASSNYGIGSDGRIALYVEEKDRSWCTSSASNDNRAVTIEVANDGGGPEWHVSAAAMKSLINLCADICKRNGIKELKWRADKSLIGQVDKQNMTVHRWFAQKSCIPINSEVLTKTGWVKLPELNVGEEILTVEKNSLNLKFDKVLDIVKPYMAKTITCQNFTATPNHRMIFWHKSSADTIKVATYEELLNKKSHIIRLPLAGQYKGSGIDISDEMLKFIISMQADGHYMREDNGTYYGVEYHFKKDRKIDRLCSILKELNLSYSLGRRSDETVAIRIYNQNGINIVEDICEKYLSNKEFTWDFLELNKHQANLFLEELLYWDSCVNANLYTSTIKKNRDIVQAIACMNEQASHIYQNNVSFRESNNYSIDGWKHRTENDEELVSCVTVPSGAFVCRLPNGYVFLIGNCPGEYLYNKHTYIALEVNKKLKGTVSSVPDIAKPYLEKGSEGIEVAYLQQDLNYLGFKDSTGKVLDTDGIFGAGTEYALKAFQKKYKLTADGEYGNASYNQMKKVCVKKTTTTTKPTTPAKKKAPTIAKPYLEQGYSNTQVKYLQQDLNYLGFKDNSNKTLAVDGIFGAATAQALKKFQKKYKLAVDGEYGNASYAQMKKVCK